MGEKVVSQKGLSASGAGVGTSGLQSSQKGGSDPQAFKAGTGRNAVGPVGAQGGQFGKWRVTGMPKGKNDPNTASRPRLIMVYGAPLSGKTSFAEKFSSTFKAPYINLEALLTEHRIGNRANANNAMAASVFTEEPTPKKSAKKAKKKAEKASLDQELAKYLGDDFADTEVMAADVENLSDEVMAEARKEFAEDGANEVVVEEVTTGVNDNDFADYEREVIARTALTILEGLFLSKQTILLEGGIASFAERQALQNMAIEAGYNPLVLWIQTDMTTIKQRLAKLPPAERMTRVEFEATVNALENPNANEAPIVISGKHTFDTQMRTVLGQLARAK